VGHAGTLDPFAGGVLIIGTNSDTKILGKISGTIKSYRAVLQLGEETDTLDLDGKIITVKPVPTLDKNLVESVLKNFIGKYKQIPPMYSAKKVNGVRLYKLARKNKTINREPVEVNIIDLTLNDIQDKQIDFSVTCSKGTYIRVLGQEIAKKLGTEGHLTKLQRISVGDFVVQDSIPLKEFEAKWMSTEH
ncbi:MAG: tRNA pseudouridine(55) synthase TruB, partial [Candidatus Neomarinimicrobiota bacterium]|nr:tRNA pseudouridine(55) synthase TruB [Candidatus Neomarinimicrobiota bacterium]